MVEGRDGSTERMARIGREQVKVRANGQVVIGASIRSATEQWGWMLRKCMRSFLSQLVRRDTENVAMGHNDQIRSKAARERRSCECGQLENGGMGA